MQKETKAPDKPVRNAPVLAGEHPTYTTSAGDTVRVVSVFCGKKSASELIHNAAVRKILYDCEVKTNC